MPSDCLWLETQEAPQKCRASTGNNLGSILWHFLHFLSFPKAPSVLKMLRTPPHCPLPETLPFLESQDPSILECGKGLRGGHPTGRKKEFPQKSGTEKQPRHKVLSGISRRHPGGLPGCPDPETVTRAQENKVFCFLAWTSITRGGLRKKICRKISG